MSKIKNPLELYKYLNKSNCRKCMLPSCLAFAVAVIQNQKSLDDCPYIDNLAKAEISGGIVNKKTMEDEQEQVLSKYRKEISKLDLSSAAERLNVPFKEGMIVISCLGKDFRVGATGDMISECHKNTWVQVPVLNYILYSKGIQPKENWVAFGDLKRAGEWSQFFSHRCEREMQKLADAHTDLFFDILHLFGANTKQGITNSDQSLVIYPLPKVPFLINYWEPEESFDSKLNILFDKTAEDNINIESLYLLSRGLVEMFRELIVKHSKNGKLFS